jgi:two-component system, NarL family, nitrate/nitrite response regulator NarL
MTLFIYSRSQSFEGHIDNVVDGEKSYRSKLSPPVAGPDNIYLVHASSFTRELPAWLEAASQKKVVIGVAADNPRVEDLLEYTQLGVLGYFNAFMAAPHYGQLLRLLANGQSWYPPALLSEAFEMARSAVRRPMDEDPLVILTKRERDVALAVAEGKSNKLVASSCNMAERTVKTHLTQIFKKLHVKDRVALVIYLNQFDYLKLNNSSTV